MSMLSPLAAAYAQVGGVSRSAVTAKAREARAAAPSPTLHHDNETIDAVELHDDTEGQEHQSKNHGQNDEDRTYAENDADDGLDSTLDVQA